MRDAYFLNAHSRYYRTELKRVCLLQHKIPFEDYQEVLRIQEEVHQVDRIQELKVQEGQMHLVLDDLEEDLADVQEDLVDDLEEDLVDVQKEDLGKVVLEEEKV
jgi:hypothetical protein